MLLIPDVISLCLLIIIPYCMLGAFDRFVNSLLINPGAFDRFVVKHMTNLGAFDRFVVVLLFVLPVFLMY